MTLAKRLPVYAIIDHSCQDRLLSSFFALFQANCPCRTERVFNSRTLCPIHDPSKGISNSTFMIALECCWQWADTAVQGWCRLNLSYDGSSHALICEFLKPATAVVNVRTIKIHQRLNARWKWTPSSNPGRFVPLWSIKGKCHLTTVALEPYSW